MFWTNQFFLQRQSVAEQRFRFSQLALPGEDVAEFVKRNGDGRMFRAERLAPHFQRALVHLRRSGIFGEIAINVPERLAQACLDFRLIVQITIKPHHGVVEDGSQQLRVPTDRHLRADAGEYVLHESGDLGAAGCLEIGALPGGALSQERQR